MSNKLNELISQVHDICGAWGMYEEGQSSEIKQLLYAAGEAGEIAIAIAKNDVYGIKDGIGDTLVCLINAAKLGGFEVELWWCTAKTGPEYCMSRVLNKIAYLLTGKGQDFDYDAATRKLNDLAATYNLTISECLQQAINEISKRTGKFVNGVFVKDKK